MQHTRYQLLTASSLREMDVTRQLKENQECIAKAYNQTWAAGLKMNAGTVYTKVIYFRFLYLSL